MSKISENLPDILGAITGGQRKTLDVIQCAISSRPDAVKAGQAFEAILIIQSMIDAEVDVRVELELPERDANKKKGMFFSEGARLLVGLQPAEVGYVKLPISCSPHTAPGQSYVVRMKIQVKKLARRPEKVRAPEGGGVFTKTTLPEDVQAELAALQGLTFSADDGGKRNTLQDTFVVAPPEGIVGLKKHEPGWVSLWSMKDHLDDNRLLERVQESLEVLLPKLRREVLLKPLLKTIRERFEQAGFKLAVAEALFIAKIMTMVIEREAEKAKAGDASELIPSFKQLTRLLFEDKRYAGQPVYLVTKSLFTSILNDTILHAFEMVSTVTDEEFGSEQEMQEYADNIVDALAAGEGIGFAQVYLPLVAAGVIANTRVTMPGEQVRDSLNMLSDTLAKRATQRNESNAFVFTTVTNLVDRGLEHF